MTEVELDTSIDAPTVIHALQSNESGWTAWYPNSFDVQVIDATNGASLISKIDLQIVGNEISIKTTDKSLDGKTMRVCVTPKGVGLNCAGYKKASSVEMETSSSFLSGLIQ